MELLHAIVDSVVDQQGGVHEAGVHNVDRRK
jgi:hypothetical protein